MGIMLSTKVLCASATMVTIIQIMMPNGMHAKMVKKEEMNTRALSKDDFQTSLSKIPGSLMPLICRFLDDKEFTRVLELMTDKQKEFLPPQIYFR